MKYQFMQAHKHLFALERMSKVLNASRSGYYAYVAGKSSKRAREDARLLYYIKAAFEESRGTYGSPRIHAVLKAQGFKVSRHRVARLMRAAGLTPIRRRRFKMTTQASLQQPRIDNKLQQNFKALNPNEKWVSDITAVYTLEGWLYIAVILDLFSRKVVGLAMSARITKELVIRVFQHAAYRRGLSSGLLYHSDQGAQYTSHQFQRLLRSYGVLPSLSSKGNCYDNAVAESFFHTLKTDLYRPTPYETREQAQKEIFEYVELFYNSQRLHSYLGYLSPNEFERRYMASSSSVR